MDLQKKIKSYFFLFIILFLFVSCKNEILINKELSSQYLSIENESIVFNVRNNIDSTSQLNFSDAIKVIGEESDIIVYEIHSKTGKLEKINVKIDLNSNSIVGNFLKQNDYLAIKSISRESLNRYKLFFGIKEISGLNFSPEICKYILCNQDMFKLGDLVNMFPNLQDYKSSLPFKDLEFPFPPTPRNSISPNVCNQCTGSGNIKKINWDNLDFPSSSCNLNEWLVEHPKIRNAIIWRKDQAYPYDSWTSNQKGDLRRTFNKIKDGTNVFLNAEPPHTIHTFNSGYLISTNFSEEVAWDYYVKYLAHSLYVEVCKKVDWSITSYSDEMLFLILDSGSMFYYHSGLDAWVIVPSSTSVVPFSYGAAVPGSPVRIFDFFKNESLLGNDALVTTANILEWCRDNMSHSWGNDGPNVYMAHWDYDGFPPVEKIISGTTYTYSTGTTQFSHWTKGCWGTTGFLRYVLRPINIPVELHRKCKHALPGFPTINRYLSHGDDPYSKNNCSNLSGIQFLIDGERFEEWFGSGSDECSNIGRTCNEL